MSIERRAVSNVQWRFGPAKALTVAAALAVAITAFSAWLETRTPWIGVDFRAAEDGHSLTVARVNDAGPAAGKLRRGDDVVAVLDTHGARIPVDASMLIESPIELKTWAEFDEHMRLSGAVVDALRQEYAELELGNGAKVRLDADDSVPLRAVTVKFWFTAVAALAAFLVCFSVGAYRPGDVAARALALCGFSTMVAFDALAVITTRPWVLDESVYRMLFDANTVTLEFAGFSFLAVFWYYPKRLQPFPFMTTALAAATLAAVLAVARAWPQPGLGGLPYIFAYAVLTIPLGIAQWRKWRSRPLERAALKWLYLITVVNGLFIAAANNLPLALGLPPLVSTVPVLFAALALFGCIALGILRYRLFDIDRWWFEAWLWALGGVLVVALDALLLWFNASHAIALGVALALAGWLWFPLRQWLWRKLSPSAGQTVESHLPALVEALFTARDTPELERNWHELLRKIFAPLNLSLLPEAIDQPLIAEGGLALRVPGLHVGECLDLRYGHKAQRLFNSGDQRLATSLLGLARQAALARRARDEHEATELARQREKELLVQDLHDGLGGAVSNIGLLAELACKESDVDAAHRALRAIAGLAHESAGEIRGFMQTVQDDDADWHDVAADLRLCASRMLEPHAVELRFAGALADDAAPPDAILRLNLFRLFKEALNNVIKHARAGCVVIELRVHAAGLQLTVSDDGRGFHPERSAPGKHRGLRHLHERAHSLGGELGLQSTPGAGTTIMLTAPLPAKPPAPGIAAEARPS